MCGLRELVSYVNNNNKSSYINNIFSKTYFQDHIDSLSLTGDQIQELRQERVTAWENYAEPGLDFSGLIKQLDSPSQEQFPMTDLSPADEDLKPLDMFDGKQYVSCDYDSISAVLRCLISESWSGSDGCVDQDRLHDHSRVRTWSH